MSGGENGNQYVHQECLRKYHKNYKKDMKCCICKSDFNEFKLENKGKYENSKQDGRPVIPMAQYAENFGCKNK